MTDPLSGKSVLILGLARQGIALAKWLCSIGAKVTVSDLGSPESLRESMRELDGLPVNFVLGEHPLTLLTGVSLLCVSGGVPPTAPIVQEAVNRGIRVTNDAQLFLERCPCHVIGITGSAGKTTTTTLVGKMCEEAGMLPWIGGNIGNPLITDLPFMRPADIAVMELSSFQLELMTSSPHVAAILNITPNHLDRHKTMEAYIEAKARILDGQIAGDIAVLGRDDANAYALADHVQYDLSLFSSKLPTDVGAWLVVDKLLCRPSYSRPMEVVCMVDDIPLRGKHNVQNVLAACAIAGAADIPIDAMRRAIRKFKPVPHRLEVVRQWMGVTFINDSIATAPERVIAALEAFRSESIVLMLGGKDKNLPWSDLAKIAIEQAHTIITFGEAGRMIAGKMSAERTVQGTTTRIEQAGGLEDAINTAIRHANDGDIVLLSPGGTSYDAYKDFEERGEEFRRLVNSL